MQYRIALSMKLIYAPWRSKYLSFGGTKKLSQSEDCQFCSKFGLPEEESHKHLILKRFTTCVIMLNLHPYNAGHILIIPLRHTPHLSEMTKDERIELMEVINSCIKILEELFVCDGINMGMNKGKASGGSIQEHLHIHVLPRFIGDTNFLAALANTKQISFDLHDIYQKLLPHFNTMQLK